jgi:hypothetical protein
MQTVSLQPTVAFGGKADIERGSLEPLRYVFSAPNAFLY